MNFNEIERSHEAAAFRRYEAELAAAEATEEAIDAEQRKAGAAFDEIAAKLRELADAIDGRWSDYVAMVTIGHWLIGASGAYVDEGGERPAQSIASIDPAEQAARVARAVSAIAEAGR